MLEAGGAGRRQWGGRERGFGGGMKKSKSGGGRVSCSFLER